MLYASVVLGACHGPSWLPGTRACVPLPFNRTVLSTTPAAFSDADLYSISIARNANEQKASRNSPNAMDAAFFQLTFNVQPASAAGCSLKMGLIPPPSKGEWGGIEKTFSLGANGSFAKTIGATVANIFPPSANFTGHGDWTLVVSTMPHVPCAYQVLAERLPSPSDAPATLNVTTAGGRWYLAAFDASLAAPVIPSISLFHSAWTGCSGLTVYYAGGTDDVATTMLTNVSVSKDHAFPLGPTVGAPQARYIVGIAANSLHAAGCVLQVDAPAIPVTALAADGIPRTVKAALPGMYFSVPFSSAAPFSKIAVEGILEGMPCDVQYTFTGDSFYAGSEKPVPLSASAPGLFHVEGSPTMFIPDVPADSQKEPFLLNVSPQASSAISFATCVFNITIFPATTVQVARGAGQGAAGGLNAGPFTKDGKVQPPRSKGPWFVSRYKMTRTSTPRNKAPIFTIVTTSETSCVDVKVGFRANVWPNGPFASVTFDREGKSLKKNEPISFDLNKGRPHLPMPEPGESIYMFVDAGYGSCRFSLSVD